MKLKLKTKDEKGITLVGLVIIAAIIVFVVIIMKWAISFSDVVKEKTKKHETIDLLQMASYSSVK